MLGKSPCELQRCFPVAIFKKVVKNTFCDFQVGIFPLFVCRSDQKC